jgi:hypothetical protein
MSKKEDILKTYYDGVTHRFRIEIDFLNKLIGHTGEMGSANETSLINLLVKFLPKRYSIGSGIVIDKEGNRSNQIDVIVYDSYYHPELFSQGAAYLYPVDVVYMTIEVKTTVTKRIMEDAIENVASVKRLKFIESPIYELKGDSYTISKTSPPIGIIFGFNSTTNFDTFESWISSNIPKNEMFDLCYILNSTFSCTFQDLDRKDKLTEVIYLFEKAIRRTNMGFENIENYERYKDDLSYPLVNFKGNSRIVDQAVGFINFLSNVYDMLTLKRITETSILRNYITDKMLYEARERQYQ